MVPAPDALVAGPNSGTAGDPSVPGGSSEPMSATARFWLGLPPFPRFEDVLDQDRFRPLPDGWTVGVADVVASTRAIRSR